MPYENHFFRSIAMEWYENQLPTGKPSYAAIVLHRLEKYIFTDIGNFPVTEIKPMQVLACLQKAEKTAPELTVRLKAMCSHVFKFAIVTSRPENDPCYGLEVALKKFRKGHYAAITVDEFPDFLLSMYNYRIEFRVKHSWHYDYCFSLLFTRMN